MSTGEKHGSKAQYPSPPVWEGAATSVFPPEPVAEHRSLPTASPNLSPKGSITILSDDELGFADPKEEIPMIDTNRLALGIHPTACFQLQKWWSARGWPRRRASRQHGLQRGTAAMSLHC